MKIKVGDLFKNLLSDSEYIVKKIANNMAMIESKDGKCQIFTDINTLEIKTFYQKQEGTTS